MRFARATVMPSRASSVKLGHDQRSDSTPQSESSSAAASITSRKIVPEPRSCTRGAFGFFAPASYRYIPLMIDGAAHAIVLIGSNGTFSAGADIKEFGTPAMHKSPSLLHLIAAFEDSTKPVVAAIAGLALGGGLEFALGCNYRVVHREAKLGLPEVKLGLLPGAGGTQRLPRLIGVEAALNVMLGAEPVPATVLARGLSPKPRRSGAMTSNPASASGSTLRAQIRRVSGQPWTRSSGNPPSPARS